MSDDTDKLISQRLIQGRPRLRFDPAFTAKVMAEVRETKVKLFIPWRKVVVPVCVVLVVVGGGAGTFIFIKQQSGTVISTGVANNVSNSSMDSANDSLSIGKPNNLSDYQKLATDAQNDIGAMSLQTGKFSDTDYADAQMADNQIF